PAADGSWLAGSGAIFDLRSNRLRRAGWTSADAAGLSILAGLVRYDEVAAGGIQHAIRITVPRTRTGYTWPATHSASDATDPALPADHGSAWYVSGSPDDRWDNSALRALRTLHGSDFEAVDVAGLMLSRPSGATR
ncbi:hypothetical protein JNW88_20270, partial [Micromonospora sp. ATA32]|nr:hypothetical protein [Micromonospora sp. ATA32]